MERVDFYLVDESLSAQQFACRLVNKAFNAGLTIRIEMDTAEQVQQLDTLLWEYRSDWFIPHDIGMDENGVASFIHVADLPRLSSPADMLLNLASTAPDNGDSYQRIAEIVPDNPAERQPMRERFRYYKELGHTPNYHPIS
ncbi:MAG: DNA polymerase III subunit chi [Pseudomonadales bacterium]|nr:DNA polymerase III subunit chi [Pseudomonadales bacterium]